MLHIGVTGGIGSGKTTFLKVWEELGVPVVYADDLAKELMETDRNLRDMIVSVFGEASYRPDGSLNRKYLADAAFSAGRVEELNEIVHPAVFRELEVQKNRAEEKGSPLFAHESALLLASGEKGGCDLIVLILSQEDQRIRRVTRRDGADRESVVNRIRKQPDFEQASHMADFVVYNDGGLSTLQDRAEALHKELVELSGTSM